MSIVARIQALEPDQYATLYEQETLHYRISVCEFEQFRWLRMGGVAIQSLIDTEDGSRVVVPVNQAMLLALVYRQTPDRVLILGSGGGSFERFLGRHLPGSRVTAVERSQQVIGVAQQYFNYPEGVQLVCGRADHFLADASERYDLVFCDIFEGEEHPDCLRSDLFHGNIHARLSDGGIAVYNLLTFNQQSLVEVLSSARRYFAWTSLMVVPDHNNAVLFAAHQQPTPLDIHPLQQWLPDADISDLLARVRKLPERSG